MKIQGTNISMIRGDSESINVYCEDAKGNSMPFVEGDMVYFTVKKSTNTEEKTLQKIITEFADNVTITKMVNGVPTTKIINGVAILDILPQDTKQLKVSGYYYDIQVNKANGTVKTIIPPSKIIIEAEVTYD